MSLALLLSLSVSLCACGSDAPTDPVEAGYKASQEGDHAAAVGHFDAALAAPSAEQIAVGDGHRARGTSTLEATWS